jgi:hypothetical protein
MAFSFGEASYRTRIHCHKKPSAARSRNHNELSTALPPGSANSVQQRGDYNHERSKKHEKEENSCMT